MSAHGRILANKKNHDSSAAAATQGLFLSFPPPPQTEHQETGVKLRQCWADDRRCNGENARVRQKIAEVEGRNAELRRRLADAQKYKEQVRIVLGTAESAGFALEKHLLRQSN